MAVEETVGSWFEGWIGGGSDPFRAHTAIGWIGKLKRSDRIILRVRLKDPNPQSLLLREASYQHYAWSTWRAEKAPFRELPRGPEPHTWWLHRGAEEGQELTISIDDAGVRVGNANVVAADVDASNGVIHVIDTVLLPQ